MVRQGHDIRSVFFRRKSKWHLELAPSRILALVLAGGKGSRLFPLTAERSKPAVPFGGKYRIVDFVLSSLNNSGIRTIFVLTQYKAQSLLEHLQLGWIHSSSPDNFLLAVPAQMQSGESWYKGTADAIYQNLRLLDRTNPKMVAVFGADHIYKMNVHQMAAFHQKVDAAASVACLPVPAEEASAFGVIQVDEDWKITGFVEKPKQPPEIPGKPGYALVSMGNYLFNRDILEEALREDAADLTSDHDFGKSILPKLIKALPVYAYDFNRNQIPMETGTEAEAAYWRDIGTIDAYYRGQPGPQGCVAEAQPLQLEVAHSIGEFRRSSCEVRLRRERTPWTGDTVHYLRGLHSIG